MNVKSMLGHHLTKNFLIAVKSHNALVKHLKLLSNHEDFELKKLLINMVVHLSKDPAVLPVCNHVNYANIWNNIWSNLSQIDN